MIRSICAATTALGVLAFAGASAAQVQSDLSFTTTGASPTIAAIYSNGQPCAVNASVAHAVETQVVTVTTTGAYTANDRSARDGGFAIYNGAFNPASPATNCVASADDGASWTLTAGTYTLVGGPWASTSPNGIYAVRLTGPGAVTVTVGAAAVPTLSEWAMILFGTILAGGAALYIQRRRFIA